jgi:uncharacterized membrane protein YkoI
MNLPKSLLKILLACSVCAVLAALALAQEKRVKMSDLPEAVQKTVNEQSKGATLKGLSTEVEKGKTIYEAELMIDGHSKDITIDPQGNVLEVEEQVQMSSLPEAVQSGIKQSAGTSHVTLIESVSKGGALQYYECQVKKGGRKSEIKIGTDGKRIAKAE